MFISVTTQFTTRESPCGELSSYNVMLFFKKRTPKKAKNSKIEHLV